MTVPLGNTPAPSTAPDELQTPGLVYMGQEPQRGNPPVIVFYRTLEHGQAFAPKAQNIDPQTGRPRLVHPVTVDLYFPNGPLAGRVYRRVGFINAGIAGPVRATAIGSINVGQLGVDIGKNSGNPYPQLNALDPDALAWASQVHQAAGGDVFAHYGGTPSEPVAAPAAAGNGAVDRFAGMPVPGQNGAQPNGQAPAPAAQPAPTGMPGLGGPPPGMPGAQPAAQPAQGMPQGMPGAGAPQGMPQGQPAPTGMAPPPGVPALGGAQGQPPVGMPGWAGQ